jgi:hypothetical protein
MDRGVRAGVGDRRRRSDGLALYRGRELPIRPFRAPFRGHDEIRAYARRNAATQRDKHVRMGRPFIDGSRVAVEWWTTR